MGAILVIITLYICSPLALLMPPLQVAARCDRITSHPPGAATGRKKTARLLRGSVLAKYYWHTIFWKHWTEFLANVKANVNSRSKNAIDACINSDTDRFLQHRFTKFSEITQCNGHYAVQGHSMSPILVPIENSYTTSY